MFQNSYAIFSVLGYGFGIAVYTWCASQNGRPFREIVSTGMIATIASLFGAKIFHSLFEAEGHQLPNGELAKGVWDLLVADPWHWARLFNHGHVFYGGFVLAIFGVGLFLWIQGVERPLQYGDFFAPGLALGLALGRIGCFFTGCCFGRPTDLEWLSVTYSGRLFELGPLLPVQLFESGFALLCFLYLILTINRPRKDGYLLLLFVGLYSSFRFAIEFLRGDLDRGLWFNQTFSTSQVISALLLLGAVAYYWIAFCRPVSTKLS